MLRIGAHLSIAGGHHNALTKIHEIGGNCLQIFSSSPRNWAGVPPTQEQIQTFLDLKQKRNIHPLYFHASYLINLADDGYIGQKSVETLIEELRLAEQMRIKGTIVHLGSFKTKDPTIISKKQFDVLISNIKTVLENTPISTFFIAENAGNKKIGWSIAELGRVIKEVKNNRLRICLDTCHFHAAGYDLSTQKKFDKFFIHFDKEIGMENLEVFQINDSKDELGSFRDRHENIGEGKIPLSSFKLLLNDARTRNKPFIIETPGFDKKGPDKKNIDVLRSLLSTL